MLRIVAHLACGVLVTGVVAGVAGCASNGEATTPSAEPTETAPTTDTTEVAVPPPAVKSSTPAATGPGDDAREVTATDCHVLSQKYEDVMRSDYLAKLSPKLSDADREKANRSIDAGVKTHAGKWEGTCSESLVGKVASESALKCAMASRSVAAFDTCLNGPPSSPP